MTKDTETENKKEKLSQRINLRLTEDEYSKLKIKADEKNLSISHFLRSEVLRLTPPVKPIVLEKKVVKRVRDILPIDKNLNRELINIGRNLNQIAYNTNVQVNDFGRFDYVYVTQSLDRITEELSLLRQKYTVSNENFS